MKGKLLADAGEIKKGTAIDIGSKVGTNDDRGTDDAGGESSTKRPSTQSATTPATTKR